MIDQSKTRQTLIEENSLLKRKIQELEELESERKRDSDDRFRLMFMNAPMPYQSLDENGHFIEVNQSLQDILGYTREELIGRDFLELNLLPREQILEAGRNFKKNLNGC